MAADAAARGPLPQPSKPLPSASPPRQGRESGPAASQVPAEREEESAHKEERDPHPPPTPAPGMARRALAADGQRRLPSPSPSGAGIRAGRPSPGLTQSSVPQLIAEPEATRAVWLPRCPSVCRLCSQSVRPPTGGLPAQLLSLRRCRRRRFPQ